MSKPRKYPKAFTGRHIADHPSANLLLSQTERHHREYLLNFDGGCSGNGREDATGTWAWTIRDPDGEEIAFGSGVATAELVTVNTAEWEGLTSGLRFVRNTGAIPEGHALRILGDSDLVVSQVAGLWKTRGPLLVYRDECLDLIAAIARRWGVKWIPRDNNTRCDELADDARHEADETAVMDDHLRAINTPA